MGDDVVHLARDPQALLADPPQGLLLSRPLGVLGPLGMAAAVVRRSRTLSPSVTGTATKARFLSVSNSSSPCGEKTRVASAATGSIATPARIPGRHPRCTATV